MTWKSFSPFSFDLNQIWIGVSPVLWSLNWLVFWGMLAWLVKDSITQKIFAGSIVFFLFLGAFLLNGDAVRRKPIFQFFHPHFKEIYPLIQKGLTVSLLPLIIGNVALGLALKMGWGVSDPIKSGLRPVVRWPKKVNHGKYLKKKKGDPNTYLGFDVSKKKPVYLKPEERNKHIQIVGSTGSGKTRFTLFPLLYQDILAGRGVVFIDAKGSSENARVVWKMVEEAGRLKDFLFFSLTELELSSAYNPLRHGNPAQLKDKITASIDWSEPFYQRICENALQTLFMDAEREGKRLTLLDLVQTLQEPPSRYKNFYALAEKHTAHIQTLESEISLLVNSPFGALLQEEEGGIDLLDVYKNNKIAYFALDTQSYQHTAGRLGKIITQDLNTLSGLIESGFSDKEKRPLAVFIDEYQAFGTRGFINALARGRSSGFWITIAHQSLGDLKAIGDAYLQQVFENTNTKVFLKVNEPESAQMFSDSVGTIKTVETTSQVHLQGADPKNIMGSQRIVYEYLIHPTELKTLGTGRAVYKTGQAQGRLSLYGYFPEAAPVQLPVRRSLPKFVVPKVPFTLKGGGDPSHEEPIII